MTRQTHKTEVTHTEYLQIMGLLVLAKQHNDAMQSIGVALQNLTGELEIDGHSFDAMYCGYTADELLKKLDLKKPGYTMNTETK